MEFLSSIKEWRKSYSSSGISYHVLFCMEPDTKTKAIFELVNPRIKMKTTWTPWTVTFRS